MIDISVKDLVKSFDSERNVLDGISFDVQEGERVGLLGKNGAGKTTLFKILTGELDYNSGEIAFASGKKVGLISQIPVYPAGYTVDDVLRTAFAQLDRIRAQMQAIEAQMSDHTPQEILDADLYFIEKIGLKEHLSPTRSNGLVAMVKQMRMYALAFRTKEQQG